MKLTAMPSTKPSGPPTTQAPLATASTSARAALTA